jgi:hypothetical protein
MASQTGQMGPWLVTQQSASCVAKWDSMTRVMARGVLDFRLGVLASCRAEALCSRGLDTVRIITPIGVVSLVLWAACAAVCQKSPPTLPDAPSVRVANQQQNFDMFFEGLGLELGAKSNPTGVMHQAEFGASAKLPGSRKEQSSLLRKYLYPSVREWQADDSSLASRSIMDRATYAASCIFFRRDDSGKVRLNTPYFLRALTAVAEDTASSPSWRRTISGPFGDFGSTIGNDAGMSLLHEFGPGIQQAMKSHAPGFVSKIQEHIGQQLSADAEPHL